jgi:hypothetical protein
MKLYKIRVTAEVLETARETRRVNVDSHVLTFGRQPAYIRAVKLPPQLADDPYLRIEAVDTPPSGVPIIDLKSERVQEPTAEAFPGDETDLKSERVQEPASETLPGPETDLKSERVQEPTAAAAPVYAAPSRRKRG